MILGNNIWISVFFFAAGIAAGSAVNVLIFKIPRKISLLKPYNICFSCKKKAPAINNFPLIAYMTMKSRCSHCSAKLPVRNIFVELITGSLFLLAYLKFGLSLKTAMGVVLLAILVLISFIDWEFMIIPNIIVLPFTLVGLAFSIPMNIAKWWLPAAFSAGAFAFMLIIHLIYPKGMGMGDVKLALMLGAFLVQSVIAALFLGFLAGSLAGIIFMISRKKTLKQFIPFGPFISIGGVIAFFSGSYIASWYTGQF